MEKIYSLNDSDNLLYQIFLGMKTYNKPYKTATQIRGWYIGYTEMVAKFDNDRLTKMVDNMGRLLVRSIIVGQIYPTDLEWVIGKTDKDGNDPMSYLMDFNETTPIVWENSTMKEISNIIASNLSAEYYWPLNNEEYPLGKVFWEAFMAEAIIIQYEITNNQHTILKEATDKLKKAPVNVGDQVTLVGLINRPEFNRQLVTVTGPLNPLGRWPVTMGDGKTLAALPTNLLGEEDYEFNAGMFAELISGRFNFNMRRKLNIHNGGKIRRKSRNKKRKKKRSKKRKTKKRRRSR